MGSNYYLHLDVCEHCGRSGESLHIGKSSAGWAFSFRGYRLSGGGYPDCDMIEDAPLKKIQDVSDWHIVIKWAVETQKAVIKDEYGQSVSMEDFWKWVEEKKSGKSHHKYCLGSKHAMEREHARRDTWQDEAGNSFTGREFS